MISMYKNILFNNKEINNTFILNKKCKQLKPENDFGNTEYKWKLIDITDIKKEKLMTQMQFRLNEGNGLSKYFLGIKDNGEPIGINKLQINETINNIKIVSLRLKAKIEKLIIMKGYNTNSFCVLVIIKKNIIDNYINIFNLILN